MDIINAIINDATTIEEVKKHTYAAMWCIVVDCLYVFSMKASIVLNGI